MNYVNDRFQELMGLEMNQKALEVMKKDVDAFMPGFSDSPEKLSRWGHHYFCDDDGGRLIFDLNINHITVKKLRFLSGIEGALGHLKGKNVVLFYMELCDESFQEGRVFVTYRKLQLLYLNHRSPFPADTPAMCPLAQAH